jgi:hypothetical protein
MTSPEKDKPNGNRTLFIGRMLALMDQAEIKTLSSGQLDYFLDLVGEAVKAVTESENAPQTKPFMEYILGTCIGTNRVVYNPLNGGALAASNDEEVVTIQGVQWSAKKSRSTPTVADIIDYESVTPLTGPQRGQVFTSNEHQTIPGLVRQ